MSLLWKIGCISAGSSVIMAAAGGHNNWELERKISYNNAFIIHLSSSLGIILSSINTKKS